jgi:hypothetical protein
MAVTLDVDKLVEPEGYNLETGIPLILDEPMMSEVVMTKFVTMNENRFGFRPEGEWFDQVTTDVGGGKKSVRIQLKGENDAAPRAVNIDDGLIIDLIGTLTRVVGLMPGRPPMEESEIDLYSEQTEEQVPLYQQWDFRVKGVKLTNGPQGRVNLTRSEDDKRTRAETDMFDTFTKMFKLGNQQMISDGALDASATETLKAGIKKATSAK